MIIVLKSGCNHNDLNEIKQVLYSNQMKFLTTSLGSETLLNVYEIPLGFDIRKIQILNGVRDVFEINQPFRLASRNWHPDPTIVDVGGTLIGGDNFSIIAGPCAVENEEQMEIIAGFLAQNGIVFMRGGAYKPRTSPYSFQGLGLDGLKLLRKMADKYNLKVVTEVIDLSVFDKVYEYADIIQVGTRNMSNFILLAELGKSDKPVILKRGMSSKINEWLMSAEYILNGGNEKVILCERGIRTFDDSVRNCLDIAAIPIVKELSHLPVLSDPSHGTGISSRVIPMALASLVAGADGIMVEVHPDPAKALSDGPQSLYMKEFAILLKKIELLKSAYLENSVQLT